MNTLILLLVLAHQRPRAATCPHQATLHFQNPACTDSNPCSIQIWRAVCANQYTCPMYVQGSSQWTRLSHGSGSATPTPDGTTWVFVDSDPVLQDNTTYIYVATNSFHSSSNKLSDGSPAWVGTTSACIANTPEAPTLGTGNSVN